MHVQGKQILTKKVEKLRSNKSANNKRTYSLLDICFVILYRLGRIIIIEGWEANCEIDRKQQQNQKQ